MVGVRIGVLAMQGSVIEHMEKLRALENVEPVEVKTLAELARVDGLILPGGESTTISKLLGQFGLLAPLSARIASGMPVWGTCAGMILLAKNLVGEPAHLGNMDIVVRRNAYGSQRDSFITHAVIPDFGSEPLELVFIRAPWIEKAGENVRVLCRTDGHIVAARQDNMLATAFHPELASGHAVHRYFADMVIKQA